MAIQQTELLEAIYGIDIAYDNSLRVKDVVGIEGGGDFLYRSGPIALQEELERLFETPKGSCVDDPSYGVDWDFIGMAQDPRVTIGLARFAALDALEHPDFSSRFRVSELEATWRPETPDAIYIYGVLECFGFDGVAFAFGPIALQLSKGN